MFVLLSDGAGLTARQCATLLSRAGHRVEALTPDPLCLCRLTRQVHRVHRVPGLGADPFGWLDAALEVAGREHADILLPVQEQVAVMSLERDRIASTGLLTAVPDFAALRQVQDKVTAFGTLTELGLPQPPTSIVTSRDALMRIDELPVFVKTPVGTASAGVRRIATRAELLRHAERLDYRDGLLVQQPASGPLIMIQSVFASGELVAFHACERVREGASGGASHKRGISLPEARVYMAALGKALNWHGALSADVILAAEGPLFIDINPRLVEPVNASLSGVDLVGALVEVARSGTAAPQPPGSAGVLTHQALLAILGLAARAGRRGEILREVLYVVTRSGPYRHSTEELTPVHWAGAGIDPVGAIPAVAAALATLIRPAAWRHFTTGAVSAYSLTPAAWQALLATEQQPPALLLEAQTGRDQTPVRGEVAGTGILPPLGARHDSRRDEPHVTEELADLLAGAPHAAAERLQHDRLKRGGVRVAQRAEVRDEQAAPRGRGGAQGADDPERVLLVKQVVQDRARDDGDRVVKVDQRADRRVGQDLLWLADVGADHHGVFVLGEHGAAVRQDNRVVVYVDDLGPRGGALRHLVHVVRGRQPGPEVDELADAKLAGREGHRTDQAGPVVQGDLHRSGELLDEDLADLAVDGVIVFAAEQVVVGPGDARHLRVKQRLLPHGGSPSGSGLARVRAYITPPCHHGQPKRSTRSRVGPPGATPPGIGL